MPPDIQIHKFRVEVTKDDTIRVREDPEGQSIKDCAIQLDTVRKDTIDMLVKMLRENRLTSIDEYEVLGANLYSVLLDNEIGDAINNAYHTDRKAAYLLVELTFREGQQYLSTLPWEYLYRPKREGKLGSGFLAEQSKLILVRNLQLDFSPQPLEVGEDDLPLRILFVAPSPRGEERVEYERILEEIKKLKEEAGDRIQIYDLVEPYDPKDDQGPVVTYEAFTEWVNSIEPHVIHFVGHGRYDPANGGQIAFMGLDFKAHWVRDARFAGFLQESPELRLIFLQACESGLANPYQALSGVAAEIAHRNIPAVVAMHYKIKQHVASQFAVNFYKALAEKQTVEYAVQIGRKRIGDNSDDNFAFALPVLYMRKSGSALLGSQKDNVAVGKTVVGRFPPGNSTEQKTEDILCPWCGTSNDPANTYCRECARYLKCPNCSKVITQASKVCGKCQHPLSDAGIPSHETSTINRSSNDAAVTSALL